MDKVCVGIVEFVARGDPLDIETSLHRSEYETFSSPEELLRDIGLPELVEKYAGRFKASAAYHLLHARDELFGEVHVSGVLNYTTTYELLHMPDELLREMDLPGVLSYITALEYEVLHVSDELLSEMDPLGLLNHRCYNEDYGLLHEPDELLQEMDPLGLLDRRAHKQANKLEQKLACPPSNSPRRRTGHPETESTRKCRRVLDLMSQHSR